MVDADCHQDGDGEPHVQSQSSGDSMLDQRQTADRQPRHRNVPRLARDVQLGPEGEHQQQGAHDGRDGDATIPAMGDDHPRQHEQQRQPDVPRCFVIEPAEVPRHGRRCSGSDELIGSREDNVQEIRREQARVLDRTVDPLRPKELDRDGEHGDEQRAGNGAGSEYLLEGEELEPAHDPERHTQELGPAPSPDDQLVEDQEEQGRGPDHDQVEMERRVRCHVW
jgi:hypothetical protein